jgi:ATP-dependent DNA helicase RecG
MESEGSGYDLMYEVLLSNGKGLPQVLEEDDRVIVSVSRRILKEEIIQLVQKANEEYQLRQKEIICLGLIAQHNILSALELSNLLNIKEANGVRHWMGRLLDIELIKSSGKTKATGYFINPEYLKRLNFKGKTTLKKIEPHRLKELIIQDLQIYQPSEIGTIHERIGKEIPIRRIRQTIDTMLKDNTLSKHNDKRWSKYSINDVI